MSMHPTTQLALQTLATLHESGFLPAHALDMGCGSGILTLKMAHYWPDCRIIAADTSPKAVMDCSQAIDKNNLSSKLRVYRSEGFSNPALVKAAPYDLIIANLLAEPLTSMALQMRQAIADQGFLAISGLLAWLAPSVLDAYRDSGFKQLELLELREWQAALFVAP